MTPAPGEQGSTTIKSAARFMVRSIAFLLLSVLLAASAPFEAVAEPSIPNYWDERERLPSPDLSGVERVRFLMTTDFPPFSMLDSAGRLTGFHVELARAICRELDIVARCQVQGLPWNELDGAIAAGQGEALIAGTAITAATRDIYAFSRPYLRFPARFAVRKSASMDEPIYLAVHDRAIGVLAGSVHETMLRTYFPGARPVAYSRQDSLYRDLREGHIDGIFGDGMRMSFWLGGAGSQNCCRFAGGPYIAPEFLGDGLAVAVRHDDAVLVQAFDYALREISVKGTFAELYLKYFPVSFY